MPTGYRVQRFKFRRTHVEQSALHLVSAWASENRLFLGQVKVEDKSNEITAIPTLLELLDISGCIITIDAMGTQTEIVHRILDVDHLFQRLTLDIHGLGKI